VTGVTRWTGHCASKGFALLAVGLTLVLSAVGVGTVVALHGSGAPLWVGWLVVVVGVVVSVLGWLLSSVEVRVTETQLVVAFGPFGWPRRSIELSDVRAAEAIRVEPMEWGGWGYRWIPGAKASAAVIRRGPGIAVRLADGRRFAVTVDDAASGAHAIVDAVAALS
jgi:hypothetical protein